MPRSVWMMVPASVVDPTVNSMKLETALRKAGTTVVTATPAGHANPQLRKGFRTERRKESTRSRILPRRSTGPPARIETGSLGGGRRRARKRASSDQTILGPSTVEPILRPGNGAGALAKTAEVQPTSGHSRNPWGRTDRPPAWFPRLRLRARVAGEKCVHWGESIFDFRSATVLS